MKPERIFAIGDIHGHARELQELLLLLHEKRGYDPEDDHLVLLGDLVDTGPQTSEVIDWCIAYQELYPKTFHPLKGNHEDMMLDVLLYDNKRYGDSEIWLSQGGRQTLLSYELVDLDEENDEAVTSIPTEHIEWLDALPYYWETPEYFFVHAGVPPLPLAELDLDDPEVKDALLWIRSEFYGSTIDFGKKIIFGHTPFEDHTGKTGDYETYVAHNMIGINTMPRNIGFLTAVELPEERFYTVEE